MSDTILLGEDSLYPDSYDPTLLHPLARVDARTPWLDGSGPLPFSGEDRWTAYELSWLDPQGKPVVYMAEFVVPADSECIIESKSFKYYLNSFNQTIFESVERVCAVLQQDLSKAAGAAIQLELIPLDDDRQRLVVNELEGDCIDVLPVDIVHYQPAPELLMVEQNKQVKNKKLVSHLLKSNCPVTGQPDWASVQVMYSGAEICAYSLLKYIVSYRQHQGFHENCVERLFMDIWQRCSPDILSVYARYTRRGGLDINPFRSSNGATAKSCRLVRQ